jgi:hypothetical protein
MLGANLELQTTINNPLINARTNLELQTTINKSVNQC